MVRRRDDPRLRRAAHLAIRRASAVMGTRGRWCLILALTLPLTACSAESNVLGLVTPTTDRESYEALLTSARAAYDRGDLAKALALSAKAYLLNQKSERAAVLFGFVNLALAGADP